MAFRNVKPLEKGEKRKELQMQVAELLKWCILQLIGGGDSAAAVNKFGYQHEWLQSLQVWSFIWEYLEEERTLPGN